MNRDNEPTISDIKPSADDIALRQRQLQARKAAAARSAAAAQGKTVRPQSAQVAAAPAKQTLAAVALGLALLLALVAGFLFMQLQKVQGSLAKAENVIQGQAENLAVLNEKLSVTGENANLSLDALKIVVKEQDSEIRKLWDVSNKRNRSNIATNQKNITALTASTKSLESKLGKQQQSLDKQQQGLNKQTTALDALGKRVTSAEGTLASMAEVELRLSQQAEMLQELEASIKKLQKSGLGADASEFRLKIEDLSIRLDRLQAAVGE